MIVYQRRVFLPGTLFGNAPPSGGASAVFQPATSSGFAVSCWKMPTGADTFIACFSPPLGIQPQSRNYPGRRRRLDWSSSEVFFTTSGASGTAMLFQAIFNATDTGQLAGIAWSPAAGQSVVPSATGTGGLNGVLGRAIVIPTGAPATDWVQNQSIQTGFGRLGATDINGEDLFFLGMALNFIDL